VLVQQVYAQNAASVLGIAMVLPVLGCVAAALARQRSVPLLFAALMLAGLVGTYTEYAPFVAPAVAGAVVLRRGNLGRTMLRAAALVGLAVVIAPLVWWRAVGTLTGVRGGAADAWPSPYLARPLVMINRLTGAGPLSGGFQPSLVGLVLGVLVLVGMGLVLALGPHRGMWTGLLVVGLAFLGYLSVERLGYTQRRAVELAVPLALFMSVAGWAALLGRLRDRRQAAPDGGAGRVTRLQRSLPLVAVSVLLVSLFVWTGVNVRSSLASVHGIDLRARHVDDAYSEALSWVRAAGAGNVSVLAPDFYEQHGIALTLEGEKAVEYPALRPDYFRTQSYWSGGTDRFWLVGEGVQVDADAGVVVHSNARFRLLDLQRGKAVIAAPSMLTAWYPLVLDHGDTATVAPGAQILVVRSAGVDGDVSLNVRAGPDSPLLVRMESHSSSDAAAPALVKGAAAVPVTLPAGDAPVVLDVVADPSQGGDAPGSIELEGIHRVG
jgi:hypothetical protein